MQDKSQAQSPGMGLGSPQTYRDSTAIHGELCDMGDELESIPMTNAVLLGIVSDSYTLCCDTGRDSAACESTNETQFCGDSSNGITVSENLSLAPSVYR
mmetsp:Transcript_47806/g.126803  ORF Transcript_47806/g.126803 Transcript_47806/m.126803 type:complete len:99 (-) Transcript_47806:408-704(-)